MDNQLLLKISLILSLIGIFTLLIISNLQPPVSTIYELNKTKERKQIKLEGEIAWIREINENFYLATLKDETGEIDLTLNKEIPINKQVEVIGELTIYNGKIQIQTKKIKLKKN